MRIILMMQDQVERLEQLIGGFLDEFLAAVPRGKIARPEIAAQWVREVLANIKTSEAGKTYAPDQYTLSLHPRDYEALTNLDHISQAKLSIALRFALESAQLKLTREPHITLATDPTLPRGEVRVIAWHSSDPIIESEHTAQAEEGAKETRPAGAFFIVDGSRHYPLERSLVSIGRRLDNHLVLEDPHVSRRHARLRARGGRFIIYDLNSTAGTRVNGKKIQEWVLRPGDVVTLATVQLIYGEDPSGPPPVTPPYEPPFKPDIERDKITPLDLATLEGPLKDTERFDSDPSPATS